MTIKFGNFVNFIVRNFVVIWEAPNKAFSGEGGGGVYVVVQAPRGRNFVTPPPSSIHPPQAPEGYFQGWGGVYQMRPRNFIRIGGWHAHSRKTRTKSTQKSVTRLWDKDDTVFPVT